MKYLSAMLMCIALLGCASAPKPDAASGSGGSLAGKALEWVGLKKPEQLDGVQVPDSALPDRRVRWRLSASDSLNMDAQGRAVALLTRVYKLKSADAFLKVPYESFGDAAKEKESLGEDLLESRDLQLLPGQHYETIDKIKREARFVGIVAFYRTPADSHWRMAFDTEKAEQSTLSIGLHACAMSVQTGSPVGDAARSLRSAAMRCPSGATPTASPPPESHP